MAVSAEMYIVISLMFAVFAAVAAIGTSVVLGVGFERLRAGFEIVKKQTGFFADAIHKLDERTNELDAQNGLVKEAVASVTGRVDKVEKQTGFFFESLTAMEEKILQGSPMETVVEKPVSDQVEEKKSKQPILPQVLNWSATAEAGRLLQANQDVQEDMPVLQEETSSGGLSSVFLNYLRSDNRADQGHGKEIVYH